MWNLSKEENNKRTYINSATGSKCITTLTYKDKDGNSWYSFDDLMTLPYTRQFAATKVSSLYALGLSKDDLSGHINGLKAILKSNDPEKYEKAFANLLDFENKANNATDAVKQITSLACVYNLINDEPIDSFQGDIQLKKMSLMEADWDLHCFFLKRQTEVTEQYMRHLNLIFQIASSPQNGQ